MANNFGSKSVVEKDRSEWSERLYEMLTDDSGEERACSAIPDAACRETPGNFLRNVCSGAASKLAEQLISPALVIPWIFGAIGVPAAFSALLVPIKDAGSLLPQLFVSARIRRFSKRKWFWAIPAFAQGIFAFAMAWAVFALQGWLAGFVIITLLLGYSILSGVASVAFKDVLAKTIDKGKRGQLLGMRSTWGGILTLAAGVVLYQWIGSESDRSVYTGLVGGGALLWFVSATFFATIIEPQGATSGGRNPMDEVRSGWRLLRSKNQLRLFILTRALLMGVPLSLPLIAVLGEEYSGEAMEGLGIMVIASGIAGIVSSPIWGRFADRSSRRMMQVVALVGVATIGLVLGFQYLPAGGQSIYVFAPLYLLQVTVHGGARLSRKTYLVDMAPEEERPLYVSLSNTLIGLGTILFGLVGFGIGLWGTTYVLLFLMVCLVAAAVLAGQLEEV